MKYERIKFLVIALKSAVEIYAWAPKPYHKFMAFKVCLSFSYTLESQIEEISVLCRAERHLASIAEHPWDACQAQEMRYLLLMATN